LSPNISVGSHSDDSSVRVRIQSIELFGVVDAVDSSTTALKTPGPSYVDMVTGAYRWLANFFADAREVSREPLALKQWRLVVNKDVKNTL
jgi:hypothetical protein